MYERLSVKERGQTFYKEERENNETHVELRNNIIISLPF